MNLTAECELAGYHVASMYFRHALRHAFSDVRDPQQAEEALSQAGLMQAWLESQEVTDTERLLSDVDWGQHQHLPAHQAFFGHILRLRK